MGMRRLSNPTRRSELSNAVLAIGLFCGQAKGDRITENVANLRLFAEEAKHLTGNKFRRSFGYVTYKFVDAWLKSLRLVLTND
jgi:hypothetical protein